MSHLNRDGVNIYYEDHGSGDKAIILSHGYSATSDMWRGQVDAFKDNLGYAWPRSERQS